MRAERALDAYRASAPATAANIARNARAGRDRRKRWAPARDALWAMLEPVLEPGATVAIVGAGNGDDLPLARIADRATAVTLLDLDARAVRRARRRLPRGVRGRVGIVELDVTDGAADRIAADAARHRPPPVGGDAPPLPGAPYDLVVGDLLYSQLLYPALVDLEVSAERAAALGNVAGPTLTRRVVERFHRSAPLVLHVHDPAAWWEGHGQPHTLEDVLACEDSAMLARLRGPHRWDPRVAVRALGRPVLDERLWRWPFTEGVDYLVRATLAGSATHV